VKIAIISPIRLFRDCLAASFRTMEPEPEVSTEPTIAALSGRVAGEEPDIGLVDVTKGLEVTQDCLLEEVGLVAAKWPELRLLAIGLEERREEVVRYGRAGFVSYVSRNASIPELQAAIADAFARRLQCPAEISGGLIRALFRRHQPSLPPSTDDPSLTGREAEVLHMIGRGLSNKEIARELSLSVATVKQHVHNVLAKLGVGHRAQAMRQVREMPWIGARQ
jgi:two-component system nitrate/nitrite response regulator NarL